MDFALWGSVGKETLIKSNINNWFACKEGTGSIVKQKKGSIHCKLVCSLQFHANGPSFSGGGQFCYFDGSKSSHWPTHDPCGTNRANQLKNVPNPHGNIFIR
ncbi:unnamed protein product [Pocillopora meandrina]|uniref:Uncharacterized protein n=1 Tax=Pocillopora meandrina TaxID=46732 RepID=A0AAU9X557_9CNID|nr:unnamed protein product [Pocillopora meandrina]